MSRKICKVLLGLLLVMGAKTAISATPAIPISSTNSCSALQNCPAIQKAILNARPGSQGPQGVAGPIGPAGPADNIYFVTENNTLLCLPPDQAGHCFTTGVTPAPQCLSPMDERLNVVSYRVSGSAATKVVVSRTNNAAPSSGDGLSPGQVASLVSTEVTSVGICIKMSNALFPPAH